ncbi:amino acid permease [Acidianus brierleyi]|uniref:Amino acid permease n=1 Tax=Acidianus brierleyi TaxID=41673 RepID=A0A2U9IGL4_9CREN|nr:amino acid permease [Acidianus brierleyi]AWR95173.1 amino acid permease [Acidianus brierleyi]
MASKNPVSGAKDLGTQADAQLRKSLNRFELLFLSLGGVIGSGWLFGSLYTAGYAGGAGVLSWIIAGVLIIFVGLVYSEIASAIPKSGGIVRYPHYSHGGVVGFIIAWAYFLSAASVPAIESTATVTYLSYFIPSLTYPNGVLTVEGIGLAYVLLILFFLLNYAGVNILGKVTHFAGWWKLIIPGLTVILALVFLYHPANFTMGGGFFPAASNLAEGFSGFSTVLYAIPTTGVIFSYLGFRQAIEYGGEGKNPRKDIPFAVIGALAIGIVLYTLLQVAFTGGVNWTAAAVTPGNWTGLLDSNVSHGPFLYLFEHSGVVGPILGLFGIWALILLIDAVISPAGTGWIYIGTAGRTVYGFASNGYLPSLFLKVGKTRVPVFSLIAALAIGMLFLLPFPAWVALVGFISSATVFTYIMGGIGLHTLRNVAPDLPRRYKVPSHLIIAPIATLAAGLIVYWSGFATLFYVVTAIFLGLPLFFGFYAYKAYRMNITLATILGVVDLGITIASAFFFDIATSGLSVANNIAFLLYMLLMIALVGFNLIVLWTSVNDDVKREIKASYWLVALIFAIIALSYFGGFGLDVVIPFPWDTLVAGAVILGFHFLAVKSGLRTEAIDEIINQTKEP